MSTRKVMLAVRVFAVLVIAGVGAAAFRLSFATLRDLAVLAHIPHSDAWLFPLVVDGTILQATLGWLVLANARERRYFTWVLAAGLLVSVAGNSIHAFAAGRSLPPWLCAIVAAIAPIALFIDIHGLAVLFRIATRTVTELDTAPVAAVVSEPVVAVEDSSAPVPESTEPVAEPVPVPAAAAVAVSAPVAVATPVRSPEPRVRPVRPVRPVQQEMLPIAVPVGS
jgi:hypothetical protein